MTDAADDDLQGATSTGLSPKVAATLAYAAWWVTGAFFLVVEPTHPFVRFHARQALFGLGAVWLVGCLVWASAWVAVFLSVALFQGAIVLAQIIWAAGALLWFYCLAQAWQGRRWQFPWVR